MALALQPLTAENLSECGALSITDEEQNHAMLKPTLEILEDVVGDQSRIGLVIYSDETPVGFLDYGPIDDAGRYHLYDFFIDQNHRRRGYGEAALRLFIDELCQKSDCHRITVPYMSFNDSGALELYEKVGFVQDEVENEDEDGDRSATFYCKA